MVEPLRMFKMINAMMEEVRQSSSIDDDVSNMGGDVSRTNGDVMSMRSNGNMEGSSCLDGRMTADPASSTHYYMCVHGGLMQRQCAPGTMFCTETNTCCAMAWTADDVNAGNGDVINNGDNSNGMNDGDDSNGNANTYGNNNVYFTNDDTNGGADNNANSNGPENSVGQQHNIEEVQQAFELVFPYFQAFFTQLQQAMSDSGSLPLDGDADDPNGNQDTGNTYVPPSVGVSRRRNNPNENMATMMEDPQITQTTGSDDEAISDYVETFNIDDMGQPFRIIISLKH